MVGIEQFAEEQSIVRLVLNHGQYDYANCAGTYYKLPSFVKIRGKPVYRNHVKRRLIFHSGSRWVITRDIYFKAVYCNGVTRGLYASKYTRGAAYRANWYPRYRC